MCCRTPKQNALGMSSQTIHGGLAIGKKKRRWRVNLISNGHEKRLYRQANVGEASHANSTPSMAWVLTAGPVIVLE
jgi:hypothetical protein